MVWIIFKRGIEEAPKGVANSAVLAWCFLGWGHILNNVSECACVLTFGDSGLWYLFC